MKASTRTLYLYEVQTTCNKDTYIPIRQLYLNDDQAGVMCLRLNKTCSFKNDLVRNWFRVLSNEALSVKEIIAFN
jgi:hypothetical protein